MDETQKEFLKLNNNFKQNDMSAISHKVSIYDTSIKDMNKSEIKDLDYFNEELKK